MRWLQTVDESLRLRTRDALFFLGRRFGVTRAQATRSLGLATISAAVMSDLQLIPEEPVLFSVGVLTDVLIYGYFTLLATMRGGERLRRNEDWGAYSNWMDWRWLRGLELFVYPVMLIRCSAQIFVEGDFWVIGDALRPLLMLAMFYSITIPELPPRQPKRWTAPRSVTAGAH